MLLLLLEYIIGRCGNVSEFMRRRRIVPARSSKRPWRTSSRTGLRRPIGVRTCSSADAGSWVTGKPTSVGSLRMVGLLRYVSLPRTRESVMSEATPARVAGHKGDRASGSRILHPVIRNYPETWSGPNITHNVSLMPGIRLPGLAICEGKSQMATLLNRDLRSQSRSGYVRRPIDRLRVYARTR